MYAKYQSKGAQNKNLEEYNLLNIVKQWEKGQLYIWTITINYMCSLQKTDQNYTKHTQQNSCLLQEKSSIQVVICLSGNIFRETNNLISCFFGWMEQNKTTFY